MLIFTFILLGWHFKNTDEIFIRDLTDKMNYPVDNTEGRVQTEQQIMAPAEALKGLFPTNQPIISQKKQWSGLSIKHSYQRLFRGLM